MIYILFSTKSIFIYLSSYLAILAAIIVLPEFAYLYIYYEYKTLILILKKLWKKERHKIGNK